MTTTAERVQRRFYVFELWARKIEPPEIQKLAAARYGVSARTIREDLRTMSEWLPSIMKARESTEISSSDAEARAEIVYKEMLNLVSVTRADGVKVGAGRTALQALDRIVDIRRSRGEIAPTKQEIELTGGIMYDAEFWQEHGDVLKKHLLQRELLDRSGQDLQ